ncbi:unnamed protein product [Ceutorhynchus assimilis]|uniref:Follistatin-like domain-containing protein n=1 Tax=Ceutorhynchus assimilis TaxID=467358 RepID=A0A9N9MR13_9CUCU|nr:unnamed protein product [Ceutorhynchus assimilis]
MRELLGLLVILAALNLGNCFTKYGRSCKDIGCPSTQECVMATDPCSYYQREGDCGSYPTCKRKSGSGTRTCSNFVCPPSQVCKMDDGTPKCVNDASKSGHVGYDTHSANAPLEPSAPPAEGGNLYPQIPKGETTARPNIRPVGNGGSGYQGGQIGSGYPGYPQQGGGYPQQNGGYPQQNGGYPQQNGGYPQNGYQGQGGYPQGGYQGYPQGGYQQYPAGYNPYQQQYPQKSSGSSITDKIKDGLKTIGTNFLKDYLSKALSGGRN